jgi:hypothetical protein
VTLAPNDKRNFHGALAKKSPYETRWVRCVTCSAAITNSAEQARLGELCQACRDKGWREPGEIEGPQQLRFVSEVRREIQTVETAGQV